MTLTDPITFAAAVDLHALELLVGIAHQPVLETSPVEALLAELEDPAEAAAVRMFSGECTCGWRASGADGEGDEGLLANHIARMRRLAAEGRIEHD